MLGLSMDYSFSSGLITHSKNFKTPFFERYFKFLPWGNCNRSKTIPKNFGEKISIILGASPPQSLDTQWDAADTQVVL